MAEVKSISLDEQASEMLSRNKEFIDKQYGGLSALLKRKLEEIDSTSAIEAELEEEKDRLEERQKRVARLEKKLDKRNKRQEVYSKKNTIEELESKKKRLIKEINNSKSEEQVRSNLKMVFEDRGHDISEPNIKASFEKQVKKKLEEKEEKKEEVSQIEDRIENLKSEINESEVELTV